MTLSLVTTTCELHKTRCDRQQPRIHCPANAFLQCHRAEDYYSHRQNVKLVSGCCPGCDGEYLDFSNSTVDEIRPLRTQGGMYSPYVFAAEAQRLMRRHAVEYKDRPIFFYLPFQSVHGPYEAPMEFVSIYNDTIATEVRRIHQGMITAMDEAIGNITQTWNETGLYANSLMWFSSDKYALLAVFYNRSALTACCSLQWWTSTCSKQLSISRWQVY
eukprot:SAG31_NODE_731_length_12498_cov_7.368336_12_plen_216_part_00